MDAKNAAAASRGTGARRSGGCASARGPERARQAIAVERSNQGLTHSRFPVYKGTIDAIVGTLFIKELLENIDPSGGPASLDRLITEIMRPAYIVPETKPISLLLTRFKANRQQMAIVVDEFGGTAGLVTVWWPKVLAKVNEERRQLELAHGESFIEHWERVVNRAPDEPHGFEVE